MVLQAHTCSRRGAVAARPFKENFRCEQLWQYLQCAYFMFASTYVVSGCVSLTCLSNTTNQMRVWRKKTYTSLCCGVVAAHYFKGNP